ncbi:hypothetical protein LguiB_016237 [Lonicera macranthoides]
MKGSYESPNPRQDVITVANRRQRDENTTRSDCGGVGSDSGGVGFRDGEEPVQVSNGRLEQIV